MARDLDISQPIQIESAKITFYKNVNRDGPTPIGEHYEGIGQCWFWNGFTHKGYGRTGIKGLPMRAHRAAWILEVGKIPSGMCVLHRCDNPSCVRVSHLFLGTHAENMQDMESKGRRVSAKGESHGSKRHPERVARGIRTGAYTKPESLPRGEKSGQAKLNSSQVLQIRNLRASGESLTSIGKRFSIHRTQVSNIVNRLSWAHI